jgi:hypothetical protein
VSLARRGTNLYEYQIDSEVMDLRAMYLAEVQVDFWSNDESCFERALALDAFAMSVEGVEFGRARGIGLIECPGGIRDLSEAVDAERVVRRASVSVSMTVWGAAPLEEQGTKGPLRLQYFENVDAEHPPIGD